MMPKYRKKPVVVEAIQLTVENVDALIEWIPARIVTFFVSTTIVNAYIKTLEGVMVARDGDYIIKGVQGEFYPCKPDIFEATYEAVTE